MTSIRDSVQNYFNQNAIVQLPYFEEVSNMTAIVVQLPQNQYIPPDYIRNLFEKTFQFGIIEKIDQIANILNEIEYQYVYIVVFNTVFAENPTVANFNFSLMNWGYCDVCIMFDANTSINVRAFYDNFIDSCYKTRLDVDLSTSTFACEKFQSLINLSMESVYRNMRQNYEQFESVVESDINMMEEKNNQLANELRNAHILIDDLRDQIKWMNKIFYEKVKQVEYDLRSDFKEFVAEKQPNRRGRNRNRSRNGSNTAN